MQTTKLILTSAILFGFASAASAQTTELTLGTSAAGGSWYPATQVMAKIIEEEIPNVRVTVMPGGSLSNIKGVSGGQYDLALAHTQDIASAMAGSDPFDAPIENVRGLMNLWTNYLQIGVRPDSGIDSVDDLAGKRLAPGNRGWGGEVATRLILSYNNLSYEDMQKVEFTGWRGMTDLYMDRQVDAVFAVSTADLSAFQEMAFSGTGLSIVPLSDVDIEKAVAENPGYFKAELPGGTYKGQDASVPTLGSTTILFARDDLPEDLIQQITKALIERRGEMVSALAALKELDPQFAARVPAVPLHPGAQAYYQEAGAL